MSNFDKLNPEQRAAVEHTDGPLLIVAGAGTGKTTVITQRLAFLIENNLAKPDEILVTTFTEKATAEMEERADKILPYGYVDLWINTFHSFCERILRDHGLDIGLRSDFKLLSQTEQWVMIRKNLDAFDLDYYRPLGNPTKFIHELIRHFSRLKDENITAADYLAYAEGLVADGDTMLGGGEKNKGGLRKSKSPRPPLSRGSDAVDAMEVARIKELANAYHVYNQMLLDNGFLDFGDLITYALKLFKERPNILNAYRRKFKYIMVDEFQDTNWAQYELVKMMAGEKQNLVVVGDDDQCLPGGSLILTKNGKKRIDRIRVNDEVATAVGKGYLSYSRVVHVKQTKKKAKLITLTTESGDTITVTDNHKLFCFLPPGETSKTKNSFYYVYLMHKQELGWRLGVTNNLAVRLKLERSADRIVAIKSFATEEEVRYYETYLSLKYGIPTVCFQERDGMMTKREWSEKLYRDLNVDQGVAHLARDLGIDLSAHQYALNGVVRGGKVRVKINLEMCYRHYRSKYAKGAFLANPKVEHCLCVETSHLPTLRILEKNGFKLDRAKKGKRLRMTSMNLGSLGKIAGKIQKLTSGIIENSAKIGTANYQHRKSLVVPAGNVFPGMYLPVAGEKGIIYKQIVKRTEAEKVLIVYDLEVERTHNFVADNIVVHNSVYRFRGASMSNIMQFKDDYPNAREVVLTKNYRSGQEILDSAYRFIKNNDPNRLEAKLKIDKKLSSGRSDAAAVECWNFATEAEETAGVVAKIVDLYKAEPETNWSDFAILIRANDTADKFIAEMTRQGVPNQFMSARGLYFKPVILDALAYLKLLDNYHESSALYRVLNMEVFKISHSDIIEINKFARRKVWSTFEALQNIQAIPGISPEAAANAGKLLGHISKHSQLAQKEKTSRVFVNFIYDSGVLAHLDRDKDKEIFDYLNQFYKKIKALEEADNSLRLKDFVGAMEMEMEAGDSGALQLNLDDADVVRVMTVHGAKGLEFKYVFVVNLVDKKFPTINRGEKISIPDALVKEKVPEGDTHIEEERRLFYVAMTRARDALFLTGAVDYGGARDKKPSKFLGEAGLESGPVIGGQRSGADNLLINDLAALTESKEDCADKYALPDKFSFSQIEAYTKCPLQYKFGFILKIPVEEKVNFIFGRLMHNTLKDFMSNFLIDQSLQPDLFGSTKAKDKSKPGLDVLLDTYRRYWVEDGYRSKKEREEYKQKGKKILEDFFAKMENEGWPDVLFLEKSFNVRIGEYTLKGAIDRVDKLPDGSVEIIDYKTGSPKDKLDFETKRQLLIYQIAVEELFGLRVSALSFYYLENGEKLSFKAKPEDITKVRTLVIDQIKELKKCQFPPKPGFLCAYCDYRRICEFAS